ncbi:MAG: lipid-binding SYLF domain-containing protein [Deltaproteobacteria bacterium]|nr:lipid-binding SYLF domain-containing protein [Deltaproteobacteria bacterium]
MKKNTFTKAILAAVLPLSFAVSAIADSRVDIQDRSDPGSLNTSDQSLMNRKESNMGRSQAAPDSRVARGMETNEQRAMLGDKNARDENELLNNSNEAYRALTKGAQPVPTSITSRAQCIAVFPNAITAAAIVGGSHGSGIASCKSDGAWSQPAFVDLNAVSFGAQLGAKATDLVFYFTSPQTVAALKQGKFEIGADASVVAGSFDRSFDSSKAGVIAYQRSSGAFIGASLMGGKISSDDSSNRAYYGRSVQAAEILENRITSDRTNPFASTFPKS